MGFELLLNCRFNYRQFIFIDECRLAANRSLWMKSDRPSSTARFVSNGIYWVSQHPRFSCEVPDSLASWTTKLTRCLMHSSLIPGTVLARRYLLFKASLMQACSVPGIYLHQVLRKRSIEKLAHESIASGINQVVVLGAGYDTLSLRLASQYPECALIEIDHPATQKAKRALLAQAGLHHDSCAYFPVDLSDQSLESVLCECPEYDSLRSTLFIIEGVTMYLDEKSVRSLLSCVAAQAKGSVLLFTYMEESRPGCYDFKGTRWLTSWWLALRHERFTWGIAPRKLPEFLSESGFALRWHRTSDELRTQLLSNAHQGAVVALGENTALVAPGSDDSQTNEVMHARGQ
ncbi:MAG: hypothetical protein CBC35_04875 [Planctomycetes bacterium TMED75]|nr:hypothetical protein [Planctomycetaceae bacterium]OUU93824.1 MAG: hypothetical protein CBC35_04875 [Planctomycetes bacterium TMED75]